MDISNTTYTMFCANPDMARIYKGLGFVPEEVSDSLGRGIAFHLLAQSFHLKWTDEKFKEECEKERVRPHNIAAARLLWPTLEEYVTEQNIIAVEREYHVEIPNTEHHLVGRFDAVVDHGAGIIGVNEYKSAGVRKYLKEIEVEWRCNTQAESVLIGAKSMGMDAQFVDVITVKDGTPPQRFVHRVERSQYKLDYYLKAVGMVADIIQFLVNKYGVEEPWPHVIQSKWYSDMSGKCNNGWCEYQGICGSALDLCKIPTGFIQRDEEERWKRQIS